MNFSLKFNILSLLVQIELFLICCLVLQLQIQLHGKLKYILLRILVP